MTNAYQQLSCNVLNMRLCINSPAQDDQQQMLKIELSCFGPETIAAEVDSRTCASASRQLLEFVLVPAVTKHFGLENLVGRWLVRVLADCGAGDRRALRCLRSRGRRQCAVASRECGVGTKVRKNCELPVSRPAWAMLSEPRKCVRVVGLIALAANHVAGTSLAMVSLCRRPAP